VPLYGALSIDWTQGPFILNTTKGETVTVDSTGAVVTVYWGTATSTNYEQNTITIAGTGTVTGNSSANINATFANWNLTFNGQGAATINNLSATSGNMFTSGTSLPTFSTVSGNPVPITDGQQVSFTLTLSGFTSSVSQSTLTFFND
jgi:hypothetical protein